jgi:hypothetical protein
MTHNIITTTKQKKEVLMPSEAKELLKSLYLIRSYSGFEEPLRNAIARFLEEHNIPYVNYNGNLLGLNHPGKPLFSAHMDMVNTEGYKLKGSETSVIDPVFTLDDDACIRLYRGKNEKANQTSLGADDKNGIWVTLMLLKEGYEINFAFCHSEEIGGAGSTQIISDKESAEFIEKCQYGVIIDRRNANDIIGYENEYCLALDDRIHAFAKENGFKFSPARGSVSDADRFSKLIECVNLSCGYYEPHTSREHTNLNELWNTFLFCKKMLDEFTYHSVSPERIRKFKKATCPYSAYSKTTTTTSFYGSAWNKNTEEKKEPTYVKKGNVYVPNEKKNPDTQKKTKIITPSRTTKDISDGTNNIIKYDADCAENQLGDLIAKDYMEEALEYGMAFCSEINGYIIPLIPDKDLKEESVGDVLEYYTCPKCGKQVVLLQNSVDALFMDYYNPVTNSELALGICTNCNGLQNLKKELKYLL